VIDGTLIVIAVPASLREATDFVLVATESIVVKFLYGVSLSIFGVTIPAAFSRFYFIAPAELGTSEDGKMCID